MISALSLISLLGVNVALAQEKSSIFKSGFDGKPETDKWVIMYGAGFAKEAARTGEGSLKVLEGEASVRTRQALSEQGTLELWVKSESAATEYTISILVSPVQNSDSAWVQVGQIKGSQETGEYYAKRISIDDPGKKFLRLDIKTANGHIWIDDLRVEKILLDTALQKNQQKVISEVLDKLRADKDYQVQAEALRTLGKNYAAQIDIQRQYLEYANGIYSSVTLVLATSERSKMANPLAYQTFKTVVDDVRTVSSPIQKARTDSLLKPLGDIATTSLNIMTNGTYAAFAEPFKTIVATVFDRSSYENAGLSRKERKFAEKNGLPTFAKTESFLSEIEKELNTVTALDKDLLDIQRELDKYRKDLDKHLKESLIAGGMGRGQENYNRVLSKDEATRNAALEEINNYFMLQAESYQNHSSSNTQFLQFMMKATSTMEESQVFKERFNQIASSVITFYDKFDRSIAADQNPFTDDKDRKVWEARAVKVRAYIKESKEAFTKAYM
ncbi:hypothetical protein CJA_0937 [Cellvibrio japonicus Ueda107]|uniref:Uncharacterized protein n=2 Tax=Cellvibrio japonicus TaxID=155077 RepID=B3PLB3_CELJU|nr:hypothetical protein CJA_0937 [Cellvibrio japonicus Ueda107]